MPVLASSRPSTKAPGTVNPQDPGHTMDAHAEAKPQAGAQSPPCGVRPRGQHLCVLFAPTSSPAMMRAADGRS